MTLRAAVIGLGMMGRHHVRVLQAYEAGDLTAAIAVIRRHIDDALVFTRRHIEAVGGEV